MKKLIFSALAAIGLLLSPSCSDDNEVLSGSDNEALVSFNVNLADGISTKAKISDGLTARTLSVKVYDENKNEVPGLDQNLTIDAGSLSKTVNITLVKGKTYNFLFWAQYTTNETSSWDNPYKIEGAGKISIDYAKMKSNDEKCDAFVGIIENYEVERAEAITPVTLKRPFAQLNFLTTKEDIKRAAAAGILTAEISGTGTAFQTSVTIPGAATTLDPWTGKVSGYEEVTFATNAAPFTVKRTATSTPAIPDNFTVEAAEGNTIKITPTGGSETTYYVLATNYFLVNPLASATGEVNGTDRFEFSGNVTLLVDASNYPGLAVPNIPVQRNHRTNIYGELLSVGGTFNVTMNKEFEGDLVPQN